MKQMEKLPLVALISLIMMLLLPTASPANLFEFTYSGTANFATAPNTSFNGSFTYDTATPPRSPGSGNYDALTQAQLNIFSASHSMGSGNVFITNDFMGRDYMNVELFFNINPIPIPGGAQEFDTMVIHLEDTTGMMFSDSSFPQDLSFLDHVNYKFIVFTSGAIPEVRAFTENISVQPVPEPTTMLLLGSGLLGLWGARKKFRR